MIFEWDGRKATANMRKHGVRFEEAATIFGDRLSLTVPDPDHSRRGDQRYITIGLSESRRLLIVVHSDRSDVIRIISAREATGKERREYAEER